MGRYSRSLAPAQKLNRHTAPSDEKTAMCCNCNDRHTVICDILFRVKLERQRQQIEAYWRQCGAQDRDEQRQEKHTREWIDQRAESFGQWWTQLLEEIDRHKWIESEKIKQDVGLHAASQDWFTHHRTDLLDDYNTACEDVRRHGRE